MGIIEKEEIGDFKREDEVTKGYENRSTLSMEERLRLMWRKDAYGRLSPELEQVSSMGQFALLMGALYGYGSRGKETFDRFVVDNKHEMFKSPKDAQNILRKDMLKHAARGSMYWAFKLGFMVITYAASTQTMNVIQNDITGTGHAACGFVLGSLFRVIQGPRQMLAAGVVGASMGFFEGITQKCLIWVTEGSYENYMLNRYNKFQDEKKLYVDKKKEENKELIDKWRESDSKNSNEEKEEKFALVSRAVIRFFRERFDPTGGK